MRGDNSYWPIVSQTVDTLAAHAENERKRKRDERLQERLLMREENFRREDQAREDRRFSTQAKLDLLSRRNTPEADKAAVDLIKDPEFDVSQSLGRERYAVPKFFRDIFGGEYVDRYFPKGMTFEELDNLGKFSEPFLRSKSDRDWGAELDFRKQQHADEMGLARDTQKRQGVESEIKRLEEEAVNMEPYTDQEGNYHAGDPVGAARVRKHIKDLKESVDIPVEKGDVELTAPAIKVLTEAARRHLEGKPIETEDGHSSAKADKAAFDLLGRLSKRSLVVPGDPLGLGIK